MRSAFRHTAAVLFALALAMATLVPSAMATSGRISRAETNADWTSGSVAGTVEWTGCEHESRPPEPEPPEPPEPEEEPGAGDPPPPQCHWLPFATIGPASVACDAGGRRAPDSMDSGVSLIWSGGEMQRLGQLQFERSDVPLSGPDDRLLCLTLIERSTETVSCPQMFGMACTTYASATHFHVLDSTLLAPPPAAGVPPTASVPAPGAQAPSQGAVSSQPRKHRHRRCASHARHRHKKKSHRRCARQRHKSLSQN